MKRALVTGGCGFLGSSIVKALLARGVGVRVLALPNEPSDNVEGLDVEIERGNVLSIEDAKRAVHGVDTVFHAAAIYKAWMPDPTAMYDVNSSGTFNMLEAARRAGAARVIYTASIVALGRPEPGTLGDETTPYEAWDLDFAYSRAKYHSRVLAEDFGRWGLDVRVVCPGVVLGPGDIAPTPSGKIVINTLRGAPPLYTDGGASYVDVRDAAEVHVLAAEKGRAGERYIASAHNLTNRELLEAILAAAGKRRRLYRMPAGVVRRAVTAMEAQAKKKGTEPMLTRNFFEYSLKPSFYDNGKAVRELGASFRPFDETLKDAIAYFRERGALPGA
jgi:dihydroflavonol-4-reductase